MIQSTKHAEDILKHTHTHSNLAAAEDNQTNSSGEGFPFSSRKGTFPALPHTICIPNLGAERGGTSVLTSLSFSFQACPWVFGGKRTCSGVWRVLESRREASGAALPPCGWGWSHFWMWPLRPSVGFLQTPQRNTLSNSAAFLQISFLLLSQYKSNSRSPYKFQKVEIK